MLPALLPPRVRIEDLQPVVDGGTVPVRRIVGDEVEVSATIFSDGLVGVRSEVAFRSARQRRWERRRMEPVGNDRWRAAFPIREAGRHEFRVTAAADPFLTWRELFVARAAGNAVGPDDIRDGVAVLRAVATRASAPAAKRLAARIDTIERSLAASPVEATKALLAPELLEEAARAPTETPTVEAEVTGIVDADPPAARHSAWYELFPRSTAPDRKRSGTFRDVTARLPYVAGLGFDVVYLTPIHPIGVTHRKGMDGAEPAGPDDPGSPWAIGNRDGGHLAIEPSLGTPDEFRTMVAEARRLGLKVALDLAFQCSPDHPWVTEHPTWFRHRSDGTIQTAENPPKRYEDIYPLDFDTEDWRALWEACASVVDHWVAEGVRTFRVDNPHTKPLAFWEWLISRIRRAQPEVLFLAEAFTRPAVMYALAKVGFTSSYTYFAWRSSKPELTGYLTEVTRPPVSEYFRPHLWPNTPDILTAELQTGGRPAFIARLVLAATLAPNYGIYGPPFELVESDARAPGSEEYARSEKYQIRSWDLNSPTTLAPIVRKVNEARRGNPALLSDTPPVFHGIDNDRLIAYSRRTRDRSNVMLVVVNLDHQATQVGMSALDLAELGVDPDQPYEVHDLLTGARYEWNGPRNYVELRPQEMPAHLFRVTSDAGEEPDER